jgi:outer membrane protein assembly factor BamA
LRFRSINNCLIWGMLLLPVASYAQDREYSLSFEVTDGAELGRKLPSGTPVMDSPDIRPYLRSLLSGLWGEGFLEASVDSTVAGARRYTVYLHGGRQYRWASVTVDSCDASLLRELSIRRIPGLKGRVDPRELADLRERILAACENNGYPFASVSLEEVSIEQEGISGRLDVREDGLYRVDSIIIKGNARIREKYFHKLIGIDPGDPYRENELLRISRRVEETGFLSEIKPFELEFFEDGVDLYTYIDRRKGNRFNGIAGFLPDHTGSGKLLVTGDINLLLINSFGRGESMYLGWKKLQPLSQELHINTAYPFLFNTGIGSGFSFDLVKQDTSYLTVRPVVNLHYYLDGMNYLRLFYEFSQSSLLGSQEVVPEPRHADMKTYMYGLGLVFRKLDYLYNPRRGVSAEVNLGVGNRKLTGTGTVNGQAGRNSTRYAGDGVLAAFIPAGRSFTFMLRNRSGWIRSAEIYENELFRLGGLNSMRGVEEQSILASAYSFFTAEVRYLLEQQSNAYLFWDGGYYRRDGPGEPVDDTPTGFGAGISLGSRLGIFSISYALGREFDNPLNISRAKIHLGYISRF